MGFKAQPLTNGFVITSIVGFLISALYVYKVDPSFGFAFALVFALMFIASLISMSRADIGHHLQVDHKRHKKKKKR